MSVFDLAWKNLPCCWLCASSLAIAVLITTPTGRAQDWSQVDLIQHSNYQAVNSDGSSAYPPGAFPIRLLGVVLNNSEDWLDPAANYLEGPMWAMGGQAEIYVQTVDPADFGGTAAWIGQNYGNHVWHFPDPDFNYTDAEWYEELDRLHLHRPGTPYGEGDLVRAGDLVELRARGGLNYKGKMNVNEQHDNDPSFDFEIVIKHKGHGLPYARPLTLEKVKDASNVDVFDHTRATGGERYQSARVAIRNVSFPGNFDPAADWHSDTDPDLTVEDGTGRTFPVHLGRNSSFDSAGAPTGEFDAVGIMDQNSTSTFQCVDGYRLLCMHAGDFHEVIHWTGGGGDNWSTAGNWDRNTTPQGGNSLVFDDAANPATSSNDLVDHEVFGIAFSERDGWQIDGNPLSVSGYIVAETDATLETDLTLGANQAWKVSSGKTLNIGGAVGGNASLAKIGAGTVEVHNDLAIGGTITVEEGTLDVDDGTTAQVRKLYNAGNVRLGNGATVKLTHEWVSGGPSVTPDDSYTPVAAVTLGAGAKLDVGKSGVVLSGADYAAVAGMLDDALTAGTTAGQIVSSAATAANLADPDHPRSIAVLDGMAGQVTARYAANGDTDLDGKVQYADFVRLATYYDPVLGDKTWSQGDFDYDGKVAYPDFADLAANYDPVFPYDGSQENDLEASPPPGQLELVVDYLSGEMTLEGNNAELKQWQVVSLGYGLLPAAAEAGPFIPGLITLGTPQTYFYAEGSPSTVTFDGLVFLGAMYSTALDTRDLEFTVDGQPIAAIYVPEPGTAGLLLAGLGMVLAGWACRRCLTWRV